MKIESLFTSEEIELALETAFDCSPTQVDMLARGTNRELLDAEKGLSVEGRKALAAVSTDGVVR